MKRRTLACVSLLFLLPAALHADPLADENAQLRQEVLDLQARNAALEHACPAAAAVAPPATVAPAAAAASPAPSAAIVAAAPAPAEAPAPPPKPYASTGCDRSYGKGPSPAKWENPKAWLSLKKDMSGSEVEALLGVEHYDVDRPSGRVQWQYGRCHKQWAGDVILFNGVLESSNAPD